MWEVFRFSSGGFSGRRNSLFYLDLLRVWLARVVFLILTKAWLTSGHKRFYSFRFSRFFRTRPRTIAGHLLPRRRRATFIDFYVLCLLLYKLVVLSLFAVRSYMLFAIRSRMFAVRTESSVFVGFCISSYTTRSAYGHTRRIGSQRGRSEISVLSC